MRFLGTYYASAFRQQVGMLSATFFLVAITPMCWVLRWPVRETLLDFIGSIEPAPLFPPRQVIVIHVHEDE